MNSKNINMYPKNLDEFKTKMDYVLDREKNNSRVKYLKEWLIWFSNLNYSLEKELDDNCFLKPFYNLPNNFALQVWKKGIDKNYDEVSYNLISNHYSIYNTDDTLIVEDKQIQE